jgi:HAD superfamily hydrolase (TIGR01509 family)
LTPALPPRAVLLDLGGTLVDFAGSNGLPTGKLDFRGREAMLVALRKRGGRGGFELLERHLLAPWRVEYERRYDTGVEADWTPHLRRLRRATRTRARDSTLLAAWLAPYAEQVTLLPGARQVLADLAARGLRLALVSNVPLPGALYERAILRRLKIRSRFDHLEWSYDAGRRKPSPVMLRSALTALGVEPHEAVIVGDRRQSDVAAGRLAGLAATIWIRSADGAGRSAPSADHTIDSIADLPRVLR